MAALTCEFPDKIRFFDQVLKRERGKLFVATVDDFATGAEVEISITIGGIAEPVRTVGKVVAKLTRQGAGGSQPPGVFVQLLDAQVEALRQVIHVESGEAAQITSRSQARIRCNIKVMVDKPINRALRTRDISRGGVCLEGALPVPAGQTVRLSLEFDDGPILVFGKVAWVRHNLAGIAFRFQSPEIRLQIADKVRRLASDTRVAAAKPTVLVVDDEVATLRAVERSLSTRGYGCVVATGGPEALSAARESQPALILLDVLLPGMNGLEVCRVLKRDAQTSRIPVMLASVLPKNDLQMILNESGALGAFSKPYKTEALLNLVEHVVDHAEAFSGGAGGTVFAPCEIETEGLVTQGWLREAAGGRGYVVSFWGDIAGTKARLTIQRQGGAPLELEATLGERTDWGMLEAEVPGHLPGFDVKFDATAATEQLEGWLADSAKQSKTRASVLIVDDDRAHLEILGVVLRNAGFAPLALESPLGVANALLMAKPSLVLLDYMIPGVECRAVCEAIRAGNPKVPIWIYSSVSEEHLKKIVSEVGADGWVRKGTRPTLIAESIRKFLADKGA
jgi:DNA-binding response OmpR family regulator/Tfp pilus assembly protein PilZ